MTKRSCKGKTKAGKACKAPPVKGHDHCMGHLDRETKEKLGFGGSQPGSGRPRKPRMIDLMREWIEDHPEVFGVVQDALKAERAIVVGNGPTAHTEMVPDWPTRIVAFREIVDRAYGRPHQSSEVTVITEDTIEQAIKELEAQLARNDQDRGKPGVDRALQTAQERAS